MCQDTHPQSAAGQFTHFRSLINSDESSDPFVSAVVDLFFTPLSLLVVQWNAVWIGSWVWSLLLCVLWNQRVGPSFFSNLRSRPSQNQRCHCDAAQVRLYSAVNIVHCSSCIFGLASGNCHVGQITPWILCFLFPCYFFFSGFQRVLKDNMLQFCLFPCIKSVVENC